MHRELERLRGEKAELEVERNLLIKKNLKADELPKIQEAHAREICRWQEVEGKLKNELGRQRQTYENCREENLILRREIEQNNKDMEQLEDLIKEITVKHNHELAENRDKIKLLQEHLAREKLNWQLEKEENCKLEEGLRAM